MDEEMEPTRGDTLGIASSRPTMKDKLLGKKARYAKQLQEVNDALDALEQNPEIERVLNVVSKVI
ncbi:hypothetical protein LCGC14_2802250 [marine sediment metagenome]|uniref:Uncharacterized protein n=1 Tax=marine sediment metagenome TaxID=412755 RepID=A0A0F8YME7_9ZZZZ